MGSEVRIQERVRESYYRIQECGGIVIWKKGILT